MPLQQVALQLAASAAMTETVAGKLAANSAASALVAGKLDGVAAADIEAARTLGTLGKHASAAIDKVDPLLATVDDIAARFARHEGSIGRLMHDPEFPEDAKELGKILKRRPWRVIAKPSD